MKTIYTLTIIIVLATLALILVGCRSTSTIYEYKKGELIRKTETTESPIKSITENLKNKTVIIADRGWMTKVKAEFASKESIMPNVYIGAGKVDHLYMSVKKGDMFFVPYVIQEWRQDLVIKAAGVEVGEKHDSTLPDMPSYSTYLKSQKQEKPNEN